MDKGSSFLKTTENKKLIRECPNIYNMPVFELFFTDLGPLGNRTHGEPDSWGTTAHIIASSGFFSFLI
jgi:hypothetical protein